jgi:predicted DCC family thiol-disulfide oxidoreductase YuxK
MTPDQAAPTPRAGDGPAETGLAPHGESRAVAAPVRAGDGSAEAGLAPHSEGCAEELPAAPLVLYDGNCGLCARSVRWILDHERDQQIVFAPLQGPTAALARQRYPRIPQSVDSVVYISDGRAHLRSKAMLHAASHLRAPWRWGYAMRWFPGAILDLAYRVVAAVRYRIWGHADACRLATPEQRRRFVP